TTLQIPALCQTLAYQYILRIVCWPGPLYLPPGKSLYCTAYIFLLAIGKRFSKPGAENRNFLSPDTRARRQLGREPNNVVPPEHPFDFWQILFAEISTVAGRFEINAAKFEIKGVVLGRDNKVCAIDTQFAAYFVSDVVSDGDHGRRY